MYPFRLSVVLLVVVVASGTIGAITYQCDSFEGDTYNLRYCALFGVTVAHDAEDVDFISEYPRPYRFEFFQSNLTEIPRSLFSAFPEMQTASLSGTGVENINKYTFEKATQLQALYLAENRLTTLNNFIFNGCVRLRVLDLSRNRLRELKEKALHELPTVMELHLSHNQLVTLPRGVFATLEQLSELYLDHNRLTALSDTLLTGIPLMVLELSYNRLKYLDAGLLKDAHNLTTLSLKGNVLERITLPLAPATIDVSENNLTTILLEPGPYAVSWLNLSTNALANIANVSGLSNLRTLDVSFNGLGALPLTTFLSMTELHTLNLEATNLSALEHGVFSQQTNLRWLDVSFNRLHTFDVTVLTAASQLDRLHLDGNNLTSLEYRWLNELFPSLNYLGLFANRWNCTYLLEVIRYCRKYAIGVAPAKQYGTVLHMTNVQGIYCLGSSPNVRLPSVAPVQHPSGSDEVSDPQTNGSTSTEQLLAMIRQLNQTTLQRVRELESGHHGLRSSPTPSETPCSTMHAYNYQIFILLILSVILIINIGFLLWVQHNANARRAVDQMIVFRREQGCSIQTALNGDF